MENKNQEPIDFSNAKELLLKIGRDDDGNFTMTVLGSADVKIDLEQSDLQQIESLLINRIAQR
jgi:hypothetical protein